MNHAFRHCCNNWLKKSSLSDFPGRAKIASQIILDPKSNASSWNLSRWSKITHCGPKSIDWSGWSEFRIESVWVMS